MRFLRLSLLNKEEEEDEEDEEATRDVIREMSVPRSDGVNCVKQDPTLLEQEEEQTSPRSE